MLSFKVTGFLLFSSIICFLMRTVEAAAAREGTNGAAGTTASQVHIGAVLDLSSTMGITADLCMSMGLSDFYSVHSDYQTRLSLHRKDAEHGLDVAAEVLELLKNEEVQGVIGSERLTDAFISELGRKAQVPVISFSAGSKSFSHAQNPYFVQTALNDSSQIKAFATICKVFEWDEVVVLYEDADYGNQFTSKLIKEFLEVDIRVAATVSISTTAKDQHIQEELEKLKSKQTGIFLVHMNAELGVRLFLQAKKVDMMSEGYGWLITDSLGNFLNCVDSTVFDSIEGVLGIRPHVPKSKNLESFKEKWKKNMILRKPKSRVTELNVYCLWAYDTIWALAMAVERIAPVNSSFLKVNNGKYGNDISNLRVSQFGPKLLSELYNTNFEGLSGEFQLIDGQLKPSALEIFNVIGSGPRTVGYLTPDGGNITKLASTGGGTNLTSVKELKNILWPGDSLTKPKGWAIGKIKVGVPKKDGFKEFVDVKVGPLTNQIDVTGFSIDIFRHALKLLPFPVEPDFIPFKGTYNQLLQGISNKTYNIVIGDTTILADRAKFVDFTLPYSESGVIMVVKDNQKKEMWIFTRPFKRELWLTILATCIVIGIVLRILEHRANSNPDTVRPHRQQLGLLFWFPIAVLAFPERNMVANNWSRFVLVLWLFMSYILMQSYTANLSAMFTVRHLDFTLSEDYNIGYQEGSFVRDFLVNVLHFKEPKLKQYSSILQFHEAMSNGSRNGGIDAIYDEIPFMKLFLHQYPSKYKMVGPIYRSDGFGFAFPLGSPLTVHFSRAILNVTESADMSKIEQNNFGHRYSSENEMVALNDQNHGLSPYNFGGLFIIMASAMLFSLFCSETCCGRRLTATTIHYSCRYFSCLPFVSNGSTVDTSASQDSATNQEIQLAEQMHIDDSESRSGIDHQSGQGNFNGSARHEEVNFSCQSNDTDDNQESEPRNDDVSPR